MVSPVPDKLGDQHGRFCAPPELHKPWHASPQARSPRLAHGVRCSSLALSHIKDFPRGPFLALLPESWMTRNVPDEKCHGVDNLRLDGQAGKQRPEADERSLWSTVVTREFAVWRAPLAV